MRKLVIVESPNKVETIQKYLGADYDVEASIGHIAKLKTSGLFGLGIDIENWEPSYSIEPDRREIVKKLKSLSKDAEWVYIATDPDREGEAIGEHLVDYLKLNDKYSRVKYNEITKDAILKAFEHPTTLDENLVNAQKARRMLDRIIGFRLSQLIKTKISNAPTTPSAGRVQSIALKLVVDREREILAFIPEKYFKLTAKINHLIFADYFNAQNPSDRKEWIFPDQIDEIKKYFEQASKDLLVSDIKVTERKVQAMTPFKQAVLYRRSPLSSTSTQSAAQKLYEGYGEGGLISYPRTDSTRLSQTFVDQAQGYIKNKWGDAYVADNVKGFSGDQDAHEAIRPTDVTLTPELARKTYPQMSNNEYTVYKLIYENTLMSLITQPIRISKQYTYLNGEYTFRNSFSSVKFDGYYVVTGYEPDLPDPNYELNQVVPVEEFIFSDHETKPAPRYSEGALIEALDNIKVGRPSTFATTVKNIKDRLYVVNENSTLKPTQFGIDVLDKLTSSFSDIINESYTAKVEEELDLIAENQIEKNTVMQSFWDDFNNVFDKAKDTMEKTAYALEQLEEPCPFDQGVLVIRNNKKGQKFVGCLNFPKCKFAAGINLETKEIIPNAPKEKKK
ncbi:type I DNA topoisomerase [Mycoplasmopsis pullorum]|uniref:type I DNA topoisomerase n=1 Tax=Mycoplasmopsis pullorum TaxID=48003 RepID=UPI00111B8830|nr:type I DNA topoisomerase [Mycoplasmopsis pullorum]TNK81672.1 type I DNA topoisomerase [Mycoplasmopsis pullorum]TNK82879.1 type I DNA topoisomerase [Mycoplasmopsis pullorum]TNK84160.1 type I DNA topoisomerase [Mycoplasmopsis pullorum]TNK85021.1 type I DNA topoisomerase [Mycoplasmopsis pullorum]TNK85507.1 type I DNA topoisomerase [Mycoplasmopsis pullorum]